MIDFVIPLRQSHLRHIQITTPQVLMVFPLSETETLKNILNLQISLR